MSCSSCDELVSKFKTPEVAKEAFQQVEAVESIEVLKSMRSCVKTVTFLTKSLHP